MLRLILAFVVALIAIASLWISVFLDQSRTQVLAANRKIHDRLVATASVVDDYRRKFGRLPSEDEFNKIVDRTPIPRGPFKANSTGPYLLTGKDVGTNCGRTDQQVSHFERAAFVVGMYDEGDMDCYSNDPPTHTLALRDDDLPTRDVPIERLLGVLLLFISALLVTSYWRNRKARAGT